MLSGVGAIHTALGEDKGSCCYFRLCFRRKVTGRILLLKSCYSKLRESSKQDVASKRTEFGTGTLPYLLTCEVP